MVLQRNIIGPTKTKAGSVGTTLLTTVFKTDYNSLTVRWRWANWCGCSSHIGLHNRQDWISYFNTNSKEITVANDAKL